MKKKSVADVLGAAAAAENLEPLAFICSRLSAGQNLSSLAAELDVSRSSLSMFVNALPDARAEMKTAREEGYRARIEHAEKLLEDLGSSPSREELAVAQARIDLLKWGAERQVRSEWGPASAQLNVNIHASTDKQFLDALRVRRVAPDPIRAALPAPVDADFSVEDSDGDSSATGVTGAS